MSKKRYCVVGTGSRSSMYINAILDKYKDIAELVAFCDSNPGRMQYYKDLNKLTIPCYKPTEFDKMVAENKPDTVIVTSMDRTHHLYIIRAMELGCDVISEKPMTVDTDKCQAIVDCIKATGKKLVVTFNYRYSPRNSKIKEIIQSGALGEVTSVHFEWLLDTSHGADYFRRWHRNKINGGGLMVHKATHHFDLVNWWINSRPSTVFAMGDLKFYGKANAEKRGVTEFYTRSSGSEVAAKDPFALKINPDDKAMMGLYFDAEKYDSYYRDQSVFGDGIDIEDNMGVMVRYQNNTVMTYSLNAHCPWEGYRVCFNGTKGRLEFNVVERAYVDAEGVEDFANPGMREMGQDRSKMVPEIIFQPHFGKPQVIEYACDSLGGHGGGDARLLDHLFIGVKDDPLGLAAGYKDGAQSILTGIGANMSMRTGLPVKVQELIKW